jgi:hypothetical protein
MRYQRLFSIEVNHGFYPNSACRDLQIEPRSTDPRGVRALNRYRLLTRQRANGIEISTPLDDDDQPLIDFAPDLELGFELRVNNPDFALFTDLSTWAELERPILQTVEGQLILALDDEVQPAPRPHDVMAVITIDGIAASWLTDPPKFTVEFTSKSHNWVYYLVTHRVGTPSIVNPQAPSFAATELTAAEALADLAVKDAFARHSDPTDARCIRWISSEPIPATQDVLRNLELRLAVDENPLNDEVLVDELPNPSIRHRLAPLDPNDPESLFHVVEY